MKDFPVGAGPDEVPMNLERALLVWQWRVTELRSWRGIASQAAAKGWGTTPSQQLEGEDLCKRAAAFLSRMAEDCVAA